MEDERPELALEISVKFGLDTTGIWSVWGLSCLRKAEYAQARDKFAKILRVSFLSVVLCSRLNSLHSVHQAAFTEKVTRN